MSAPLKKPQTAYFLYLNSVRSEVQKRVGTSLGDVAKAASEQWNNLAPEKKKPFEEAAAKAKKEYEEYIKTDEGKAALAEKKGERQDKKDAKIKKEMKTAAKGVEKDEKLKKPTSAYWLWLNDNREKVTEDIRKKGVSATGPAVAKAAGEAWKNLPAAQKSPYEAKAKEQKDAYDAYVKSEDGQAALKAHKDAVAEAKSSVKGAPAPVEKKTGKRKAEDADEAEEEEADDSAKEPSPKKGRGKPAKSSEESPKPKAKAKGKAKTSAPEQPSLDPAVLAEAEKEGLKGPVLNLINREEIKSKNFKAEEILSALKQSKGLVNKAKNILLAGA